MSAHHHHHHPHPRPTKPTDHTAILAQTHKDLRKQDKIDNVERQKRIDEYIRLQTLEKIAADDARTERIRQAKLQDKRIKPTDFHLLVDHLHHQPDPRHPVSHAPDIRLGKSRPRRKPRTKIKRAGQHRSGDPSSTKMSKISLVKSAYDGNLDHLRKLLASAHQKQQHLIRTGTHHRKHNHGAHRNSTAREFKRTAQRLQRTVLDVDGTDARGVTALSWAARQGHEDMVVTLLAHGARVAHTDVHTGKTPLHHAAANGYLHIVRTLLEHDAELSPQDKRGNTPLILAAQFGHDRVVFELLRAGAAWDCTNDQQGDALLVAKRLGHHHVLRVIKEHLHRTGEQYTTPVLLGPTVEESMRDEQHRLDQFGPTLQEQLALQSYSPERAVRQQVPSALPHRTATLLQHKHVREMSQRHHRHPTGFRRSQQKGLASLDQVRWGADVKDTALHRERALNLSIIASWNKEWGKLPGETNGERLERLGDRQNKMPGQCPHLSRGQVCYSMRELGQCEYLHIPEKPAVYISKQWHSTKS